MKKSSQILLFTLLGITMLMTFVLAFLVLFKQTSIPKLLEGEKGQPGESATQEQIDKSVSDYFDKNPIRQPVDGNDAPAITDERLASIVADYMLANPVKPGQDGEDGAKGSSCTTVPQDTGALILCEDGTSAVITNGKYGQDGRTPVLRCNENKNRWEVQYIGTEGWTVVKTEKGENVKCKSVL